MSELGYILIATQGIVVAIIAGLFTRDVSTTMIKCIKKAAKSCRLMANIKSI